MKNVQSSFYPHKTIAFDATDPSRICRMFAYDLAANTLVVCRFDEGFTFVRLAEVTVSTFALKKS